MLYGHHRTVLSLFSQYRAAGACIRRSRRVKLVSMTAQAAGGGAKFPGEQSAESAVAAERAAAPLQRLIQERLRERNWSYGEVARRGGLPRATGYTLATPRNLVRPPRPATIDALARGLDVPVSLVRAAAAESTGLHYSHEAPPAPGPPAPP